MAHRKIARPKKVARLRRITPKQAYSFSRLTQKKVLKDDVASKLVLNLRGTDLKHLADEVIQHRDSDADLTKASRGARVIVRELTGRE